MNVGSFKCYRTVFIRTSAVIYLGVSIEELLAENAGKDTGGEVRKMHPNIKRSVFESIAAASTEELPEEKVFELVDKIIDMLADCNLTYDQAHKVLDSVGATLGARSCLMKP